MNRVELPFERASAATARQVIGEAALALGAKGSAFDDALIVAHELVSNALDHGVASPTNCMTLTWSVDEGLLRIGVQDRGTRGLIEVRVMDLVSDRGRGLALVDSLSERWAVERSDGTLVSAWIRLEP